RLLLARLHLLFLDHRNRGSHGLVGGRFRHSAAASRNDQALSDTDRGGLKTIGLLQRIDGYAVAARDLGERIARLHFIAALALAFAGIGNVGIRLAAFRLHLVPRGGARQDRNLLLALAIRRRQPVVDLEGRIRRSLRDARRRAEGRDDDPLT